MPRPKSDDSLQRGNSRMTLPPEVLAYLRRRGATSRKGRQPHDQGPHSYTLSLQRNLGQFNSLVHHSDPRITRGLSPNVYDLIVALIIAPRTLDLAEIKSLGDYLAGVEGFAERMRSLGLSADSLAAAVNAYTFAEKVHLIDAAELLHHGLARPSQSAMEPPSGRSSARRRGRTP
jgi:hypothetical protein